MPTKATSGTRGWVDPDDPPPLDNAFFDATDVREGVRQIRPEFPKRTKF